MLLDRDTGAANKAAVPQLSGRLKAPRAPSHRGQSRMRGDTVVRRVLLAADKGFFCRRKGEEVAERRDVNS